MQRYNIFSLYANLFEYFLIGGVSVVIFAKKNARAFAYVHFFLYLCTNFMH